MPLITLTTDIGQRDFLVGGIKGQLLQAAGNNTIVDITHQLSPFNYPQAAYFCRYAIKNYPAGSIHIVLVNVFDQKIDHLLFAAHDGYYIGCADNGLLTMILEELPSTVVALPLDKTANKNIIYCSSVFARAISELAAGKSLAEIGDPSVSMCVKNPLRPKLGNNWIEGQIIFIDNFENVIINITKEEFEEQRRGRSFKIIFRRNEVIDRISDNYADVAEGEKLAMFNSASYLEIAINKGNAAGLFGLMGYSDKQVLPANHYEITLYQTIRVYFE